jgi:hypothetical protein
MYEKLKCRCGRVWGSRCKIGGDDAVTLEDNFIPHRTQPGLYHYCARPFVDARGFVVKRKEDAINGFKTGVVVLELIDDINRLKEAVRFTAGIVEDSPKAKRRVIVPHHIERITRENLPAKVECRKCKTLNEVTLDNK